MITARRFYACGLLLLYSVIITNAIPFINILLKRNITSLSKAHEVLCELRIMAVYSAQKYIIIEFK